MAVPKRLIYYFKYRMWRYLHSAPVPTLAPCPKCGEMRVPHRVCPNCGYYKGERRIEIED